jgi:hypothetical protein
MTIESAFTKIRANLHRLNFVAVLLAVNKRTIAEYQTEFHRHQARHWMSASAC